ncbi:hypothetical protein PENTCL1PPCAC_28185, partial [Pristionchus entomophagus]
RDGFLVDALGGKMAETDSPPLSPSEKEFNALRKIVFWQWNTLRNHGIRIDAEEYLGDLPERPLLHYTINQKIHALKECYVQFGSALIIVLKNDERVSEWKEQSFLPKTVIDVRELLNAGKRGE